ncbi:hypothetical protein [Leptotrichia sp. oral taxon 847]|uniref:hypothetical protein n=1 Tax=Leptotrichia sp. oral taxon 847 TaxID=1785996 RepID=UPI0007682055|nr:hypothetical protein [Leptotrichia sp. oral taxon 847]AMD94277.1 hypothetical protein AXF11_00825 [Leptotrichia sp. oral taxon 847]
MKKIRKIGIMFFISAILISAIACGNGKQSKNNKIKDYSSKVDKNKKNEVELKSSYGDGENRNFTTDGKLHEDKFLNKKFGYTDTSDEFEIKKDAKGYYVVDYDFGEDGQNTEAKKDTKRLKVYKNFALVKEDGDSTMIYAYDTKIQKLVFLNSNGKIFMEATEME